MDEWTKEELMNNFAARKVEDEVENKSMTNEEALSILHCPDTVGGLYSEEYGEALNMAMEALKREPCEDAISRQAVLDQTYLWSKDEFLRVTNPFDYLRKRINALPPVNPQSNTGRWIDRFPAKECKCSVCDFLICINNGSYIDMVGQMKYCPNFGAKMAESEDK